ncbi:HGL043Cp [Eremothecium sinecaudum]|uniref:HGL043Cp n=1 Tax=Eremothecium sinecaudum TaxID=45286 RepID=A0A0X8HVI4_9SACH|nr:HGL043Cp [Eremothecium sinecaudum]AMD22297.1 HGL043Cp [Eremothecium sinecaudum]
MFHEMAPWVPTFTQSMKNHVQPFIPLTFSTVDPSSMKPKCRTVVFRGFLFEDKNCNVLTFNTDTRSDKFKEIDSYSAEKGTPAPFEACFYFPATEEQFRFSGSCFVVSRNNISDLTARYSAFNGTNFYPILSPSVFGNDSISSAYVNEELYTSESIPIVDGAYQEALHTQNDLLSPSSISSTSDGPVLNFPAYYNPEYCPPSAKEWELEIHRHWLKLSRTMKSHYRGPDPGAPLTPSLSKQLDKIQRGVDGAGEDTGLDNFGLVCLCVDQVNYLNLHNGRGGERWKYTREIDEKTGLETWSEQELCP